MKPMKEAQAENITMDFDMEVIDTYFCHGCNKEVQIIRMKHSFGPLKGKFFENIKGCDCDILDHIKKQQKESLRNKLINIFEKNSLLNDNLKNATFDNFDPTDFPSAFKAAKEYVDNFNINQPKNLIIQGSFGTGKSHLSVAIAKALTEKGYTSIFISTPKLLTKFKSTFNNSNIKEEDLIKILTSVDLCVFDDIGTEGITLNSEKAKWPSEKLFEIIDGRSGKFNIFTTNLTSTEFESTRDSQRIFSRMLDNAEIIIMNGNDRRKKHFLGGN